MIIDPISMIMCLTYSSDNIPMLLAVLTILYFYEKIEKMGWMQFFAILGAIMAFFSMLSFPLIVLGIPLLFKIWCDGVYGEKATNELKDTIICTGAWGISYGIAWGMKWILGTIFSDYNFIHDAFRQANGYYDEGVVTVTEMLLKNIMVIAKWPYLLLFVAAALIIVVMLTGDKPATDNRTILAYCVIASLPFAMMIFMGEGYANTHYWMAYKQLGITACAGLCIISDFRLGVKA